MKSLRNEFLLDKEIIFLNHGSFGACPKSVFKVYQQWQKELERQPVRFLSCEYPQLDHAARTKLGAYLGAKAENLVFIPNATHGVNIVARSLKLKPGDEILSSNMEYGACNNIWDFVCSQTGAKYHPISIPVPFPASEEMAALILNRITPRTKVIFLSHIASPTGLILPVEKIATYARSKGILTLVDGAHAPGQMNLNLEEMGVDFYTGNCHKWMLAPKGAGFLYASSESQKLIAPLIISWGWSMATSLSASFHEKLFWNGTRDPAAYLSVPAAIEFMQQRKWDQVRDFCHSQVVSAIKRLTDLGSEFSPFLSDSQYIQMAATPIPDHVNTAKLADNLMNARIVIPITEFNHRRWLRLSYQAYNCFNDILKLEEILRENGYAHS